MVYKTKICEVCKASFVPDDDEDICMFCFVELRDKKKGKKQKGGNSKCQ